MFLAIGDDDHEIDVGSAVSAASPDAFSLPSFGSDSNFGESQVIAGEAAGGRADTLLGDGFDTGGRAMEPSAAAQPPQPPQHPPLTARLEVPKPPAHPPPAVEATGEMDVEMTELPQINPIQLQLQLQEE